MTQLHEFLRLSPDVYKVFNEVKARLQDMMKKHAARLGWVYPEDADVELALFSLIVHAVTTYSELQEMKTSVGRLGNNMDTAHRDIIRQTMVPTNIEAKFVVYRDGVRRAMNARVKAARDDIDRQVEPLLDACCHTHRFWPRDGPVQERVKQFIDLVGNMMSDHKDRDIRLLSTITASAAELSVTLTPHSETLLDVRLQEFVKEVGTVYARLNDKTSKLEVSTTEHQSLIRSMVQKLDESAAELDMAHTAPSRVSDEVIGTGVDVVDTGVETASMADVEMTGTSDVEASTTNVETRTTDVETIPDIDIADVDMAGQGRAVQNVLQTYIRNSASIITNLRAERDHTKNHLIKSSQQLGIELPSTTTTSIVEAFTTSVQDLTTHLKDDAAEKIRNLHEIINTASSESSITQVSTMELPEKLQTYITGISQQLNTSTDQVQTLEKVLNTAFGDISLQDKDRPGDQAAARIDAFVGGIKEKLEPLEKTVTDVKALLKTNAQQLNIQVDPNLSPTDSITAICSAIKGRLSQSRKTIKTLQDAIDGAASELNITTQSPSPTQRLRDVVTGVQAKLSEDALLRDNLHREVNACILNTINEYGLGPVQEDDTVLLIKAFVAGWLREWRVIIDDYKIKFEKVIILASSSSDNVCRQLSVSVPPRAADAIEVDLDNDIPTIEHWCKDESTRLVQGLKNWQSAVSSDKEAILTSLSELVRTMILTAHMNVNAIPKLAPQSSIQDVRRWAAIRLDTFRKLENREAEQSTEIHESQDRMFNTIVHYVRDFAHRVFEVAGVSLNDWPMPPGPDDLILSSHTKEFLDGRLDVLKAGMQAQRDENVRIIGEVDNTVVKVRDVSVETMLRMLDKLGQKRSVWMPDQSVDEYSTWMSVQATKIVEMTTALQKEVQRTRTSYQDVVRSACSTLDDIFQSADVKPKQALVQEGCFAETVVMFFGAQSNQITTVLSERRAELIRLRTELPEEQVRRVEATAVCYNTIKDMFVAAGLGVDQWEPPSDDSNTAMIQAWLQTRCTGFSNQMKTMHDTHHAETTQLLDSMHGFVARALQDIGEPEDELPRPTVDSQKDWTTAYSWKLGDAMVNLSKGHENRLAGVIKEWVSHVNGMAKATVKQAPVGLFGEIGVSSSRADLALWRDAFQTWWKDEFARHQMIRLMDTQKPLHKKYHTMIVALGSVSYYGLTQIMTLIRNTPRTLPKLELLDSKSIEVSQKNANKITDFHQIMVRDIKLDIRKIQQLAEGLHEAVRYKRGIVGEDTRVLQLAYAEMKRAVELVNKQSAKIQALRLKQRLARHR